MKKIIIYSKLTVSLSLLASCYVPSTAQAGELIGSVQSRTNNSGYYGSGSMTNAQRLSGYPIQRISPFLLESSYHGSNYYSYEQAVRLHKRQLSNYSHARNGGYVQERTQGNATCGGNPGWCQQELVNYSGASRSSNVRLVSHTRNVSAYPVKNVREAEPKLMVRYEQQKSSEKNLGSRATPKIQNLKQSDSETEKLNDLSFLSDPAKKRIKAESEEGKQSIWTHFQRALTGY